MMQAPLGPLQARCGPVSGDVCYVNWLGRCQCESYPKRLALA
jgi:hypothetical protein